MHGEGGDKKQNQGGLELPPRLARGVAALWAGVVIGGSLIAAPAKFRASTLSLEVGLDVGRAQFAWLGVAEVLLCVGLLVAVVWGRGVGWRCAVLSAAILVVQRALIMPPLDERTLEIIAGNPVPPSSLHWFYIGLELLKVILLGILVFRAATKSARSKKPGSGTGSGAAVD